MSLLYTEEQKALLALVREMAENEIKNTTEKHKIEAEIKDNSKNTIKNKKLTIMGLSVWRIMAYFVIYSVVGYIIETIFGIITKGVWESRQSFLYGPFCAIYGLEASIMIMFLHKYSKNYTRLFIGGFIVGSIVEYLVSWIGELLLGVKWWDYSDMPLNINGRICVYFSIFWGFLALYLIASFNPRIDRLINWIKSKLSVKALETLTTTVTLVLLIDCIVTGIALSFFLIRMVNDYDLNVPNKEIIAQKNERKDFVYHVGGYDDCTEALVILCMGMEQVDVNQQKYMLFKLEKGKIQDGLVTITMPDEQGCYDLTGWIIKNPFSEEKTEINSVSDTWRFTINVT